MEIPYPNGESNSPVSIAGSSASDMDEDCIKCCKELAAGKTIKDLRRISSWFSQLSYDMERKLADNITIEDFEKIKKNGGDDEDKESY